MYYYLYIFLSLTPGKVISWSWYHDVHIIDSKSQNREGAGWTEQNLAWLVKIICKLIDNIKKEDFFPFNIKYQVKN